MSENEKPGYPEEHCHVPQSFASYPGSPEHPHKDGTGTDR